MLTVHTGVEMSSPVRVVESPASRRHGRGINNPWPTETEPAAKLVLCYTTSRLSIVCTAVVVSVAVVFIMGSVIVLAAEDSSHSLARGWRVRGESPIRYKINYSSQWLAFGCCCGA